MIYKPHINFLKKTDSQSYISIFGFNAQYYQTMLNFSSKAYYKAYKHKKNLRIYKKSILTKMALRF